MPFAQVLPLARGGQVFFVEGRDCTMATFASAEWSFLITLAGPSPPQKLRRNLSTYQGIFQPIKPNVIQWPAAGDLIYFLFLLSSKNGKNQKRGCQNGLHNIAIFGWLLGQGGLEVSVFIADIWHACQSHFQLCRVCRLFTKETFCS